MFRSIISAAGILAIAATSFAAQSAPAAQPKATPTAQKQTTRAREAWASGEISRFDPASKTLVVKQGGSEQTFTVADNTRVMEGKKQISLNDLASNTGHRAKVRYSASGSTKTVDRIELAEATSAKPAAKATKKS
jgi:hypothetical protein